MSTLAPSSPTTMNRVRSQPRKAKLAVESARRIIMLISTPDGDSLGASIVLKRHLTRLGKEVTLISGNPISENNFTAREEIELCDPTEVVYSEYDLIIVLDTANPYPQLVDARRHKSFHLPESPATLSLDHHRGNEGFALYNIWEPEASSTCEVVFRHFLTKERLPPDEATLLLAGISSDTGHFKWMTTPRTLEIAARLQRWGADLPQIVDHEFFQLQPPTLRMMQMWLSRIQYHRDPDYVSVSVTEQELAETGLSDVEYRRARAAFEHMFLQAIAGFPIGIYLVYDDQRVRGRLFGNNYRNKVDLSQLSRLVGGNGGGHFNASGFVVSLPIDEVMRKLDQAIVELKQQETP